MCPDVAGFVANQLLPTFKKFRNLLQINYHPFGPFADTRCEVENARMICTCQHGPEECQKNALQACVIGALSNASDYLDIVACTQGPSGFNEAFTNCIANSTVSGKLNQNRMLQCANTDEGKLLMARHGILSRKVHENINWVPWIAINGIRIPAAEEHFEDVLCNQYFDPRPPECPSLKA
ncbi:gamma interferon inducible lysosomal thiol reductase [Necator americanus]|uniref:Gamma interferon inducible lysosomal thiol reductase n=1 Tax=Necator americanus TaxID=51031 RepID=W2T0D3_NECAM|nr:gamma interferon inducible lysosomal thiol reductase [Necator americanus]ETN75343.1 gamma interferon inducible lysosomal thiol reductase [Necator americanus]